MRKNMKLSAFAGLAALTLIAAGCNAAPTGPTAPTDPTNPSNPSNPSNPTNPSNPVDPTNPIDPVTPTARYQGTYSIVAPIDFTQQNVLPGILGPALGSLSQIHDHPGQAVLGFLENSGIPYLSSIMMKVPDFLMNALGSAVDTLIKDKLYQGYPVVDRIASIIQGVTELTKKMEVHEDLTIGAANADKVPMDQQVTAIGFTLFGQKSVVPLSAQARPDAHATMYGTITPAANAPIADASFTIEQGTFKLPIGELVYTAAGPLVFKTLGGGAMDLNGALKNVVPCQSFATTVSNDISNILTAQELQQLCEGALDLVADKVEAEIFKIKLDNVKANAGSGKLYDASLAKPQMDYQSDRVAEGLWSWSFTVSTATANVPSTFAGDRVR